MKHKQIIIGGTGRSGTSILRDMIGTDPRIHCFGETFIFSYGKNVFDFCDNPSMELATPTLDYYCWRHPRIIKSSRGGLIHNVEKITTREEWMENLERIGDEVVHLTESGDRYRIMGDFIDELFLKSARFHGAEHWCEKTPPNLKVADKLIQAFPEVKFIHIYRHPYDVIASLREKAWWGTDLWEIFEKYKFSMNLGLKFRKELPEENYREVCMETFLADPAKGIKDLFDWIGLDFQGDISGMDLSRGHTERWKRDFSIEDIQELRNLGVPEYVEKLGYDCLELEVTI